MLAIATNIPVLHMTAFVLHGHIYQITLRSVGTLLAKKCALRGSVLLVMNIFFIIYFFMYDYFIQAGGGMEPKCLRTEAIKALR